MKSKDETMAMIVREILKVAPSGKLKSIKAMTEDFGCSRGNIQLCIARLVEEKCIVIDKSVGKVSGTLIESIDLSKLKKFYNLLEVSVAIDVTMPREMQYFLSKFNTYCLENKIKFNSRIGNYAFRRLDRVLLEEVDFAIVSLMEFDKYLNKNNLAIFHEFPKYSYSNMLSVSSNNQVESELVGIQKINSYCETSTKFKCLDAKVLEYEQLVDKFEIGELKTIYFEKDNEHLSARHLNKDINYDYSIAVIVCKKQFVEILEYYFFDMLSALDKDKNDEELYEY